MVSIMQYSDNTFDSFCKLKQSGHDNNVLVPFSQLIQNEFLIIIITFKKGMTLQMANMCFRA